VTVRRLEDDVAFALATGELAAPEASAAAVSHLEPLEPQTGAQPRPGEERVAFVFDAPSDVARLFRATLATIQRRIEHRHGRLSSEGEALDAMLEHAFTVWAMPSAKLPREHRVFARDGFRCTVPGCTSYSNLHDHHIDFHSAGGSDALSNRTTLCAWHHLRGVHVGLVRCSGQAPGRLRFDLGLRPGRPPLARYRSGDRRV
jgi:hypothetical protein